MTSISQEKYFTDKTQFCTRYNKNWPIKRLYLSSQT